MTGITLASSMVGGILYGSLSNIFFNKALIILPLLVLGNYLTIITSLKAATGPISFLTKLIHSYFNFLGSRLSPVFTQTNPTGTSPFKLSI